MKERFFKISFYIISAIFLGTGLNSFLRYTQIDQLFVPRKITPLFNVEKLKKEWIYSELKKELIAQNINNILFLSNKLDPGVVSFQIYPIRSYSYHPLDYSKYLVTTNDMSLETKKQLQKNNLIQIKKIPPFFELFQRRIP